MTVLSRPRVKKKIQRSELLRDTTIRDFSGGWNVADNDLNLQTNYSTILQNTIRSVDGSMGIRPGTKLFADVTGHMTKIINMEYFRNHLIVVGSNGKIVKVDSSGKVDEIWSSDWAEDLPGSPSGWDATTFVSFARFNGDLTVHNGINKPLSIDENLAVNFVRDRAIPTNAFTPIGRYAQTQGRYLVVAGDPDNPSTIYVSTTDSTLFIGDVSAASLGAVNIDLGSRVSAGDIAIKGLGSFRDRLIVAFEEIILPVTLDVFDATSGLHIPTISDEIENHGALSHRSMQTVGEDMFFADLNGVSSVRRSTLTSTVKPEKFSHLIDPALQIDLDRVVDSKDGILAAEDEIFSVYDAQAANYMLFIPNEIGNITETRCFVFKKIDKLKISAWADWRDWNFTCGCRSQLNRLFFADRKRPTLIWIMGEEHHSQHKHDHNITRDYVDYEEMFSDGTVFTDKHGWTPVTSTASSGVPIHWIWELPWSDSDTRFNTKNSRYINFDTEGDQDFTCEMFIDNIYEDRSFLGETWLDDTLFDDGFGWDAEQLDPALSISFVGGDAPGFGLDEFGRAYGGGRPTRLEQLYDWSEKYKIFKLRFSGKAKNILRFVSISLAYTVGSIRR